MKRTKHFFVAVCLLLLAPLKGWCDITVQVGPDITLTVGDNYYVIEFESLDCCETTHQLYTGEIFSKISYPADYFGLYHELDSIGLPTLPARPIDLQLPDDATNVQVSIDDLHYFINYDGYHLNNYYYPYQDGFEGTTIITQFDFNYYNSEGGWGDSLYSISNVFDYFGASGIHFNILPVQYSPADANGYLLNEVRVVSRATYKISFSGSSLLDMMQENVIAANTDVIDFFDNYNEDEYNDIHSSARGEYAILTTPNLEEGLEQFVQYKTNIGYDVSMYVESFDLMSPSDIRQYIRDIYFDSNKRLRFVLLVGDYAQIPASAGITSDVNNPPTDVYYYCLKHDNVSSENKHLTPSIHLGRWPVSSTQEIQNIAKKTIITELALNQFNDSLLNIDAYTGTGNHYYLFEEGMQKLENKILSHLPYTYNITYGSAVGANPTQLIPHSLQENKWILCFRGHGSYNGTSTPYNFNVLEIDNLQQNYVDYYPFSFVFACETGRIDAANSFTKEFLCKFHNKGAATHLGASTNSNAYYNNSLMYHVFKRLKQDKNLTMASIINKGKAKFMLLYNGYDKANHIKKYNFYGDPSLFIKGIELDDVSIFSLYNLQNRAIQENVHVDYNKNIQNIIIYDYSGKQICRYYSMSEINQDALQNGVYLIKIVNNDGTTSSDFFIVKH